METRVNAIKFLQILVLALTSVSATGASPRQSNRTPGLFIAAATAYYDFKEQISGKRKDAELGRFFSDIKNYEIVLADNGYTCSVDFRPRAFNGTLVRGGGAHYVVEVETAKILSIERYR